MTRVVPLLICALTLGGCHLVIDPGQHVGVSDAGPGVPDAGPGVEVFAEMVAGTVSTCARTTRGRLFCWGWNGDGQIGPGAGSAVETPLEVGGLEDVVDVAPGRKHTCALQGNGSVLCWGDNARGQLGDGSFAPSATPVQVTGLDDAVSIGSGRFHTCAVRADGIVVCWGANDLGALGDGTEVDRGEPVPFGTVSSAAQVVGGIQHTCVRRTAGSVACAGLNLYGQLGGNLPDARSLIPIEVDLLEDAQDISAVGSHVCARRSSGDVVCWGANFGYQLGLGDDVNRRSPATVPTVAGATAVAAGFAFSCAAGFDRDAPTVWCWGTNERGQLGTGLSRLSPEPMPAQVSGLAAVDGLTAGDSHVCAWQGALAWCWGSHLNGELGVGDIVGEDLHTPNRVLWP